MKNAKFVALALLLVLMVGCVSNVTKSEFDREYRTQYNYGQRLGLWFVDRFNDITDMVQLELMVGAVPTWPLINVRATKFVQVGMGWFDGYRMGFRPRSVGVMRETRKEYGVGALYWVEMKRETVSGVAATFDQDYEYAGWDILEKPFAKEGNGGVLDIGATVYVVAIGLHANIATFETIESALQLCIPLDLILVLCNYPEPVLDFMKDDRYNNRKREFEEKEGITAE